MPIGPFKDFSDCVKAQRKKGHDSKSAQAICGEIQKRAGEKADWRVLNFIVPIQNAVKKSDGFFIRGVAINETTTRNNVKYVAEELSKAAPSLKGKPILKDHNNSVDSIIGIVTENVKYNDNIKAIEFEGQIDDAQLQSKIEKGFIKNVSVGAFVSDLAAQENESAVVAKGIEFVEISLVAIPADPGASFAKAIAESYERKKEYGDDDDPDEEEDEDVEEKAHNFKDMDECMKAMMGEGHSRFEARSMCKTKMGEKANSKEDTMEEKYKEELSLIKNEMKADLESFKKEFLAVFKEKPKTEEDMKDMKKIEELQKQVDMLVKEKKESTLKGEVGMPQATENDGFVVGNDKEVGMARGTVITMESYPSKLKRFQTRGEY